jgi:hypothetical protein
MQGHKAGVARGVCAAAMAILAACSNRSAPNLALVGMNQSATQDAAIDRQIPEVCLKVVETKLACLENKQAVDRVGGKTADLLSDRVQIAQAEQDRTVTLHNAIILRGTSPAANECKRWASSEITDLTATKVRQIHAAGGDASPCERAVDALRDNVFSTVRQSDPAPNTAISGGLSRAECDRLVRRSLFNMTFPPNDPMEAKLVATCVAGRDHYTRSLFNCVFTSKYSDAMDCAYLARGIDRSKKSPELAARKIGDDGSFQSSVSLMVADVYKDQDPHKVVDQITRDQYLSERDNILKSLGESPPSDRHLPFHSSYSTALANGLNYWIVREEFIDLQLVKVVFEESKGSDSVICARYGSTEKIAVNTGFCAALIKKYLHTELADK